MKIVSWNVNSLSTIVNYHPWNVSRLPFKALLDQLDADIVCFQEHKLQRRDVTPAIACVPGYDGYFSFSRAKKGYSGVAVYLRQHTICLNAEEGITGRLKSPSSTSFMDLPEGEKIGGYPTSLSPTEAVELDSEGRAVMLELPNFVFIGVYCPAVTVAEREIFRRKFLAVLEERARNLIDLGKAVVICGDLNICRAPIDTADPVGGARRTESGVFEDTPTRRWLHRILYPNGPFVDTGRYFHSHREGMFTCWEQRIQARAGNYGSRIDYILTSTALLDQLTGADIDPSVVGSDHCPIWATINIKDDDTSPLPSNPPRLCARYWPEAVPSRSIRSLFSSVPGHIVLRSSPSSQSVTDNQTQKCKEGKRRHQLATTQPAPFKKQKTVKSSVRGPSKDSVGQRPVSEFFKPKNAVECLTEDSQISTSKPSQLPTDVLETANTAITEKAAESIPDPVVFESRPSTNASWTSIFTKKGPPLCDVHGLPCIELVTKKPGPNIGRRFWICSKPVGPGYDNGKSISLLKACNFSGQKWEINREYRCGAAMLSQTIAEFRCNCRSFSGNPQKPRIQSYPADSIATTTVFLSQTSIGSEMSDYMLRLAPDNTLVNGMGEHVVLKGVGLGGWLNMENFITGFPSREFQVREELLHVLGKEKYDAFFNSILLNFFADADAKFLKENGLNALRIPFNYNHFLEQPKQLYPFKINSEGFKHLDRVVNLCATHRIYAILDLHAVPGGQNTDWHSDSPGHHASFWDLLDYQNWVVDLWREITKRYKTQPWIAGFNPLNEPTDKTHRKLLEFYDRIVKAIRSVDADHLIFLDANTFGSDFSFMNDDPTLRWKSWKGIVYSVHDYCKYGFPGLRYQSTTENQAYLERSFEKKCAFMRQHNLPIWNGEFGPVYDMEGDERAIINHERYEMLQDQLSLYKAKKIVGWSIWTYKDIGFQGLVYLRESSPYISLLVPFLKKKKALALDAWGASDDHLSPLFGQIEEFFRSNIPEEDQKRYPWPVWKFEQWISRVIRNELLSEFLVPEWSRYFAALTVEQLDDLGKSFALENCVLRERLNQVLKADSEP